MSTQISNPSPPAAEAAPDATATSSAPDTSAPQPATTTHAISLRHPSTSPTAAQTPSISPPPLKWLSGRWHVTHSTLPMWKKNKNVTITYTALPNTSPAQLDDLVEYEPLSKSGAKSTGKGKVKTVKGVDKPFGIVGGTGAKEGGGGAVPASSEPAGTGADAGAEGRASLGYNWRGKGWLAIASSKWEILGWGEEGEGGNAWVVTYFAKTLFTPAGIDVYSRKSGGLSGEVLEEIRKALGGLGEEVGKLSGEMFEIVGDAEREE